MKRLTSLQSLALSECRQLSDLSQLASLTKRVGDLLQVTKLLTFFDVFDEEKQALDSFRQGEAA